ncbi:hypothetical protein CHELA1G11_20768 [Hyphomicrobiales bacterium]|nr:hypothetical protein CHELA1G11_20768 [Hyphomicrobiales bacterium]CAH1691840.1 hypothetical protein CHELA1G2_21083 [Hyphomicrobiales bacterium]
MVFPSFIAIRNARWLTRHHASARSRLLLRHCDDRQMSGLQFARDTYYYDIKPLLSLATTHFAPSSQHTRSARRLDE